MQLAVSCPYCEAQPISEAREVWALRSGRGGSPFGARILVGCRPCVLAQVRASTACTARSGWWTVPWGLLTPIVIAHNLVTLAVKDPPAKVRERLLQVGLAVDDLEVGDDGLSRAQRRLADGAVFVLASSVHADGVVDPRELAYAIRIAREVVGDAISLADLEARLAEPPDTTNDLQAVDPEGRYVLLRAACEIAMIDGEVSDDERVALHVLARHLGSAPMVADLLLEQLAPSQAVTREKRRAEAAAVIGVAPHASEAQARSAYERALLRIHGAVETADDATQETLATELTALQQAWKVWHDAPAFDADAT
ncbi:MAG: TerB family tellurite resistance protein [Alphaproteobacteria bacterium]|nr:TerB family tellurite resistance protein [Alphaproteobacteria bacterium]